MPNSTLTQLGQNVRERRHQKALSQEQLADLTGMHRTYIGGIERGERNVSLLNLVRLAHALGVSLSELVRGIDQ